MTNIAPLVDHGEAAASPEYDATYSATEALSKPYRLGLILFGIGIGLFSRLAAASDIATLDNSTIVIATAVSSGLVGLGLVLTAAERDRFGAPLAWMAVVTTLSWAALNWLSPPFAGSVTVWSQPDQLLLAIVGAGNGLLLAGLVALAFVRRRPTFTVAATLFAGVFTLAANSVLLRQEWTAIVVIGLAFAWALIAWDRSPRREPVYAAPDEAPRISRAALSFASVALCGTALQLWLSRTDIPRSLPAVGLCVVLIGAAFASMVRVRREIENRETALSEWASWMRETRSNDFRAEMENFESAPSTVAFDPRPSAGTAPEAPRKLSFSNLTVPEVDDPALPATAPFVTPDPAPGVTVPTTQATTDPALRETVWPAKPLSDIDSMIDAELAGHQGLVADNVTTPVAAGTQPSSLPRADTALPGHAAPTVPDAARASASPLSSSGAFADALLLLGDQPDTVTSPSAKGAFSSMLGDVAAATPTMTVAGLDALDAWLHAPAAGSRHRPLLVAVEAMTLDEYESLPPGDAAMATAEITSFLNDAMPAAELVSWIDGPYFIAALASVPHEELGALNSQVLKQLRPTNGVLAMLRPSTDSALDDLVDEAVLALLQARRLSTSTGR